MVQVSYPGVYVVEVPSGVHTISGVATSIAAFFGRASQGPLDRAVRCLSFADFVRAFGRPHPQSDLAASVRQFFDNGGTDCYVVRLAHGAVAADVTLRNRAGSRVLIATARSAGAWGNGVRLEIDYDTPNPDDTFNLRVLREEAGAVTAQESFGNLSLNPDAPRFAPAIVGQQSGLIDLKLGGDLTPAFPANLTDAPAGYSQSRRPWVTGPAPAGFTAFLGAFQAQLAAGSHVEISVNGNPFVDVDLAGVTTGAADLAAVATNLETTLNSQLGAAVAGLKVLCRWDPIGTGLNTHVLRITADSAPWTGVTVRRARAADLAAPLMLGLDQGGIEVARYSHLRPVPTGTVFLGGNAWGAFTDGIDALAGLQQSDVNAIQLTGMSAALPVALVTTLGGDRWYQSAGGGMDGVREKLRRIADAVNNDPAVPWRAAVWGYHLALKRTTPGTINDAATLTSSGSAAGAALGSGAVGNVRQYSLGNTGTGTFQSGPGVLGKDGGSPGITVADYLGSEAAQTGFHALDGVDLFNLMVIPGDREITEAMYLQLIGPASGYCNDRRAFLLIDAPASWTSGAGRPTAGATEANNLRALVVKDHSAVFYPRLVYSDAGVQRTIGPSGAIAGLLARIDSTRGVWKAPAGVEADLRGILDLDLNLTDRENGVLNKLGVNCLRKFPSGLVNWGARTLDGADDIGSEWKYIPIRRLALFLEESLFRGTKWVVFEPNDEPLWARIRMNLNAFMTGLFRQGAFQGSTPDKAFYVKCDAETTTQADRNLGIVNIEVGFAPLKPAEFVVLKIQQIAGDLNR